MTETAQLPRPGVSVLRAHFREAPEDFQVDERLGFAPDGRGEHLLLRVRKRGANTAWVGDALAKWAGIDPRGVGYAGLKDRHAVTCQTFSLHLPGREPPPQWPLHPDFEVLSAARHGRKIARGALAGNAFRIVLRGVEGERAAIDARVAELCAQGVPNYFGEQRFGRGGGNIDAARRMFAGQRVRREQRGMLLSAARSSIFNAVLAERVADGSWCRGADGEVWMLDGSQSVFGPEDASPELDERCRLGDIHPTGPLWGAGALRTRGALQAMESRVAAAQADLCAGLEAAGLRQERRALRLVLREASHAWHPGAALELTFFLPAGAYATAVLHALGEVVEAHRSGSAGLVAAAEEEPLAVDRGSD